MQWHLDAINVTREGVRIVPETGHGIVVAILDTGVWAGHPQMSKNTVLAAYTIGEDGKIEQLNPFDPRAYRLNPDGNHGTAIAGLICGKTFGVAPRARLVSIVIPKTFRAPRVTDSSQEGTSEGAAKASMLIAALEHLEYFPSYSVLNLSVAIPVDIFPRMVAQKCRSILQKLVARKIVTTAAAGNRQMGLTSPGYPASWPEVVSVGATDQSHEPLRESLSTEGALDGRRVPDVMAPGKDVVACNTYDDSLKSGTSFSCAIVSGVVALVHERKRDTSFDECRQALRESGEVTHGVVQAPEALRRISR